MTQLPPDTSTPSAPPRFGALGGDGPTSDLWPLLVILIALVAIRWGTFTAPPTWDAAMSVWPAALEISDRNSITEVLALPTYGDSGPNTHTLSLVTLVTAGLVEIWGPATARLILHLFNALLLLGIGLLVARVVAGFASFWVAWLAAGATVLAPLMVAQSTYLYTELPSAFFVMFALVAAFRGRNTAATAALAVAILIKPLALVGVPAVALLLALRQGVSRRVFFPFLALIGLVPAFLVPQPAADGMVLDRMIRSLHFSWNWLMRAPELLLLPCVLIIRRLLHGKERGSESWHWFIGTTTLLASMTLFFSFNGAVTAGHIFIPRYGVMLIGPVIVVLADALSRLRLPIQIVTFSALIGLSVLGMRGPLALGSGSPLPPEAERSLAFLDLFEEHKRGLEALGGLSASGTPGLHDHYASYGFRYPGLGHFDGEVGDLAMVRSKNWELDLPVLPEDFTVLLTVPILGGDGLIALVAEVSEDARYDVRKEILGSSRGLPVQIVRVRLAD